MNKEELKQKAIDFEKNWFDKDIAISDLLIEFATEATKELEAQNRKIMCLNEEIVKALKECLDYEWLPAHNGKAKYLYLQTVVDIVNEKFEEVKEK